MRVLSRYTVFAFLLILLLPGHAPAQYMFLDSNGDGVNDASDRIDPDGPTTIDIWVDTSTNRDGSPAVCDADPATRLTINQWEVVLRAVGGTLRWGPLDNILPISSNPACFADAADTTDPVWYHNGWGGYLILDPGRYRVGRVSVEVATGNPAIIFTPNNPSQPTDITSFGSKCVGKDFDNTYKLGLDWRDADGIRGAIVADAGGPYLGSPSIPIQFDGAATLGAGSDLAYSWDFGDGAQGTGVTPTHAYAATGDYRVTLRVTDGVSSSETWTTAKVIVRTPPVARSGGPYAGYVGISVFLDGRGSSDENGDPLSYVWNFGDTTGDRGSYAYHTYHAAGAYTVTLTVSDGVFTSSDATTATIDGRPQHPPSADTGGPYQGFTGVPVSFNGGGSDADGDPITYRWLFGDYGESALSAPQHTYTAAGTYEVILEVNDGMLTTSDVTTATIVEPQGAPPVANAGGPYKALTGQIIEFDGSGSSDPDGDPITLAWNFGDGRGDFGLRPGHSYRSPGTYQVTLTVTDGTFTVRAAASAAIVLSGGPGTMRAFIRGAKSGLALGALGAYTFVQIEPVGGSFDAADIDLTGISLRCEGSSATNGVRAVVPAVLVEDTDGNGVAEVAAAFRPTDLRRLLGHIKRPVDTEMQVVGVMRLGNSYSAGINALVIPASGKFAPVVRPNPFNPQATVSFTTSKPGRVNAQLFDLNGRLVKTVLRESDMDAGSHDLALDARAGNGETLASGVYFLRITGPDGSIVTRISVAK